jgi:hypothetical protein
MAWEGIEERLKGALTVKVSFPAGTIWLPDRHLSIDDWLTSISETDEELRELDIPRIRFLQNRWPIDRLIELEWDDQFANKRVIGAMSVGERAYILFCDWGEYQVIAAIEPKDKTSLYGAVVTKLLENPSFVPTRPDRILNRRPDLLPGGLPAWTAHRVEEAIDVSPPKPTERWKSFLSDILEGWILKWLNFPEQVYWHEDTPESISKIGDTEHKKAS